jgi:hypothetical protein
MAVVIKRTNKYKALIKTGVPSDVAIALCEADLANSKPTPEPEPVKADPLADLVAAGWDPEIAQAIIDSGATNTAPVEEQDTLSEAERLVAESGFDYAKGRVYVTPAIVKAVIRVTESGRPEIVPTSGAGRTKAVLLNRTESGDTFIQNLA